LNTYKVLVLSLKKDIERREHITSVLDKLGLKFEFFDATSPEDLKGDYYTRKVVFADLDNNPKVNREAVIATFVSHLQLLKTVFNSKQNTLVLEDDLIPVRDFNFDDVDFTSFDVMQLMSEVSCCCQFYNWKSAGDLISYFSFNRPTQAFDWELHKLRSKFNIVTIDKPVFKQSSEFISNLAPNGY
tara:strand:+ start:563 stop:1120 length:558 start_codon:yes stop_codon:yes gene_type:complete